MMYAVAKTEQNETFWHPKFWPIWLLLGILRIIVALPQGIRMAVGRSLGRFFYIFAAKRKRIALVNLQACFPEKPPEWHQQILKKHFDSLGMAVIETGMCWWTPDEKLIPLTKVHGIENLQQALARNKGVILLGGHFTSIELGLRLLKPNTSATIYPVYQRHGNPLLEHIITSNRLKHAEAVITSDDVRSMLRALKNNGALWYAPDQAYHGKNTEMVPFFDVAAPSNTSTSRLAKLTGAAVIPLIMRRREDNAGYELYLYPAFNDFPSEDPIEDTARYHQLVEKEIIKSPQQYLWVHKRFKNRPPEYKNLYE